MPRAHVELEGVTRHVPPDQRLLARGEGDPRVLDTNKVVGETVKEEAISRFESLRAA